MQIEDHKPLVNRYLQLYSTGDVQIADEIIAADFVDHTHPEVPPGPEAVKRMVIDFRSAFPDAHATVEHVIGEGDMVAFHFVLHGAHRGTFAGVAPTGKQMTLNGVDFIRIADGRLVELWSVQDTLSWALQLGLVDWVGRTGATSSQ